VQVRGWTPDGKEVELLPWQECLVRGYLECRDAGCISVLPVHARGYGKSVVAETISRLERDELGDGTEISPGEGWRSVRQVP
jgi:hypothetical protein